ncbi:hypothetical protein Malapachy_3054 [Malassezia pachydermatis]|uniref:Uncharacterized protein n=1 Tax=Malassezia pachydermatis TaxID=77020 RepID=A0A0M9VQZ3_9BASI|nr:hypothetical protein Malapachy_3054 [Malassezia pachydermatis]KOS16043.1 hypothetical protein Malapachy_3054 [Malassezia pachydermatis]
MVSSQNRIYEGSPKRMAIAWGVMLVSAFSGYFVLKSVLRARKKDYITMQAQLENADAGKIPKQFTHVDNPKQKSPVAQLFASLERQWDKKVAGK